VRILAIALMILIYPVALLAAGPEATPRWSLELKGGAFFPDAEGWSKFYGSSYTGQYGGAFSYQICRQLEVGLAASYTRASGSGALPQHGTSGGSATFEQAPLDLFILARGLFDENQLLVPYAGGGYSRTFYRIDVKGGESTRGSVNGYHARAGVQLLLDRIEPDAAENLFQEVGVRHSYFFVEGKYLRAMADTVSGGSVNLGGSSCLAGFRFEF
jgi:hypothetical protein